VALNWGATPLLSPAERDELRRELTWSNLVRLRALAAAFCVVDIALIALRSRGLLRPEIPEGNALAAYADHCAVTGRWALLATGLAIIAVTWRLTSPASIRPWHRWFEAVVLTSCIVGTAMVAAASLVVQHQIEVYFILLFVLAAAIHMEPLRAVIVHALALIALIATMLCVVQDWRTMAPSLDNLAVMVALAYMASRVFYRQRVADYAQRRLIARQSDEIRAAHERVERLLHNVLPAPIADRLQKGEEPIAEWHEAVTILFADVVDFLPMAQTMSPHGLVDLLNDVFSAFDDLAEKHGLEKIKTIGDAYMAAAGLPLPCPDHAGRAARMALDVVEAVHRLGAQKGMPLSIRVGLSSGPAVAGVIGKRKFIYDLWGETVNVASRMETHGLPGHVQVTGETRALLQDRFEFEDRGVIDIKGYEPMHVHLLRRELPRTRTP